MSKKKHQKPRQDEQLHHTVIADKRLHSYNLNGRKENRP